MCVFNPSVNLQLSQELFSNTGYPSKEDIFNFLGTIHILLGEWLEFKIKPFYLIYTVLNLSLVMNPHMSSVSQ